MNNVQVNSITNQHQAYEFDNIVTKIFTTLVLQYTDHDLISLIDQINFVCLNHSQTNKTLQ